MTHPHLPLLLTLTLTLALALTMTMTLALTTTSLADPLHTATRAISPDLAAGNCTQLRLPTALCSTCAMKPFDTDGNFAQNLDGFDLSAPRCQRAMARYVALNPCDTVRAAQLADQTSPRAARGLEIFMYAMCETCCDCIPIGATAAEYDGRRADLTLLTPLRGNCVMHYLFDTCKILPNVADVARPVGPFSGEATPVCEVVNQWRGEGFGRNWQLDPAVEMLPFKARRFLHRFTKFVGCRKRGIWESCIPLEQARGRI